MDAREVPWDELGLGARITSWLDTSPDLLLYLDATGNVRYTNRSFEAATGCSFATCGGTPLAELRSFGDATGVVLELVDLLRDHPGHDRTEDEIAWYPLDADGERRHSLSVRADRAGDGELEGVLVVARDVTRFRETERSLRDREEEFRTLAENTPDNIIRYDLDGIATYCNQEIELRVPTSATLVVGKRPTDSVPPGTLGVDEYEAVLLETLRTGAPGEVELSVVSPDGRPTIHNVLFRAEHDAQGTITGAVAIGRDVSDLVRARQAANEREREFRTLADNAGDHIVRWDTVGRVVYANPRMLEVLGKPAEQVFQQSMSEVQPVGFEATAAAVQRVLAGGPAELVEQHVLDQRDGSERIHQVLCVPERGDDGEVTSVLGVGRDVTDSVRHREELERVARTDLLTGLPNSQALYDRAPGMLEAARRSRRRAAVLMLDLDGFKTVNDTLGHAAGDALLREVAERIHARLRSYDLFVRLGGDEFVIVVDDLEDDSDLAALGSRIQQALTEVRAGTALQTRASVGVAVYPEDGDDVETLVRHADMAMYQAKRAGRSRVEYFRPELSAALQRRATIERALEDPDLTGQLAMHVQPVFWMEDTRQLRGAEALLRWNHPVLGEVSPSEFIPVAEETGTIHRLGRWVLEQAAAAVSRWNRDRAEEDTLLIGVNFSTSQLLVDDIGQAVGHALARQACSPEWLIAEITESILLEDSESVQTTIAGLRATGVRFAIDDFGTGYSALHYLARFPIDVLKIDRTFVHGIGTASEYDELVRALVALARSLNLIVVAEGIETCEQLDFLADLGCDHGQGYLLGRPVPVEEFERLYLSGD